MFEEGYNADVHKVVMEPSFYCCDHMVYLQLHGFTLLQFFCVGCSDTSIHYVEVEEEERRSIVEEALEIRRRRQALSHCDPKPDLVLIQPIRCLS